MTVTPNWYRINTLPKFGLQSSWITGAYHYIRRTLTALLHRNYDKWCRGEVVITIAQLHSIKPELRFCAGSNPARRVGDSRWWGSLTMAPAGNKAKRLSSVNHTTRTIHHHHHQCWYVVTFLKKTSAFVFRRFFDLDCFYFCVYAFVTVIMGYILHWSVIPAPLWNFVASIWNPCLSL